MKRFLFFIDYKPTLPSPEVKQDFLLSSLTGFQMKHATLGEYHVFTALDTANGLAFSQEYMFLPDNKCHWKNMFKHVHGQENPGDIPSYEDLLDRATEQDQDINQDQTAMYRTDNGEQVNEEMVLVQLRDFKTSRIEFRDGTVGEVENETLRESPIPEGGWRGIRQAWQKRKADETPSLTGGKYGFRAAIEEAYRIEVEKPTVRYSHKRGFFVEPDATKPADDVLWIAPARHSYANRTLRPETYPDTVKLILELEEYTDYSESNSELAKKSGMGAGHTGGGCMAFSLDAYGTEILITDDNSGISAHPDLRTWSCSREPHEELDAEGVTLAEALTCAVKLKEAME